jgi:type IV fimbrial biogenesis protein FimT
MRVTTNLDKTQRHLTAVSGFTLIEVLMVMAVLGVVAGIAIPSMREFLMRNTATSLSNEFYSAVTQARSEAISRNSCVSICQSTSTQNAISGGTLSCVTTGTDWLRGWIIVTNPTCDSSEPDPVSLTGATVLKVTQPPPGSNFEMINAGGGSLSRRIMFDSRGLLQGVTTTSNIALGPANANEPSTYRRQICIAASGRVTVRAYAEGCS